MGVNPTTWGFSVYQEIIDKLVKAGILRQDIATIGDADTDAKKQVLFEKVRAGAIRVLLGSTQKWAPAPTSRSASSRCITWTPRGSLLRLSSVTAVFSDRQYECSSGDLPLRHGRLL